VTDADTRLWHPWLRINRVLRVMRHTRWSPEAKIGLLSGSTQAGIAVLVEAFRRGMRELGYVEGKTFVLEARYAEGQSERLPELARELVGHKVDVIVASTDVAIAAVKRETRTLPIVMAFSTDPVGTGLVRSLAHPGGNITGLSNISAELSGKRLELLREVGQLTGDATEPAWNGYLLMVACPCGVVFERWVTPEDADADLVGMAQLN
jgi:hypothetical protein